MHLQTPPPKTSKSRAAKTCTRLSKNMLIMNDLTITTKHMNIVQRSSNFPRSRADTLNTVNLLIT